MSARYVRWGVLWRSKNALDGERAHVMWEAGLPVLFRSRDAARKWVTERYGYIRERPDLRTEPHGWRVPQPIRLRVNLEPVGVWASMGHTAGADDAEPRMPPSQGFKKEGEV